MNGLEIVREFNDLYGIEKGGKVKIWSSKVGILDGKAVSIMIHGQIDGKQQTTIREYTMGKNIGKKNETSALEQCIRETIKKRADKIEKENYSETIPKNDQYNSTDLKVLPMLASKFDMNAVKKKKNNIIFPCYAQPKLDGVRALAYLDGDVVCIQSRTKSLFESVGHIADQLKPILIKYPNIVLDGELYTKNIAFEELVGLVKTKYISDEDEIALKMVKYHIYDMIDRDNENLSYVLRYSFIKKNIPKLKPNNYLEVVQTELVEDIESVKELFTQFIEDGYEGLMLRNVDSPYRQNFRSHDLQKYKEFFEDEFEIIGFKEGEGRDAGSIIWICRTPENKEFKVRPKGTLAFRKELYKDGDKYIGKMLTVIYQELTEENKPRFPVGKAVREDY
jgi:DNA ligase-1